LTKKAKYAIIIYQLRKKALFINKPIEERIMKKRIVVLTAIVLLFATNSLAGIMPILLNCTFTVQGNILTVDVHNQAGWSRNFDLNEKQVTIIKNETDGSIAVSIHKEGSKYWQVGEMYDISLKRAAQIAPLVDAHVVYERVTE
jgi:hypothetical protein